MNPAGVAPAAKRNLDAWAPMLDLAATEVFELMLNCRLTTAESASGKHAARAAFNIAAMVGMAGELCGVMCVQCSPKSAALMASKMLGVEADKVGDELYDAFGEICNMVAGNFKNKIPGLGDGCMLSVPTVVVGEHYSVHPLADSPTLERHMVFEGMPVVITLKVHD